MATAYEIDVNVHGEGVDAALPDIEHRLRDRLPPERRADGEPDRVLRSRQGGGFAVAIAVDAVDASIAEREAFDIVHDALASAGVDTGRALVDIAVRSSS